MVPPSPGAKAGLIVVVVFFEVNGTVHFIRLASTVQRQPVHQRRQQQLRTAQQQWQRSLVFLVGGPADAGATAAQPQALGTDGGRPAAAAATAAAASPGDSVAAFELDRLLGPTEQQQR